jgi:conjugative transposon TraK protein
MIFEKMRNIDSAFKMVRTFSFVVVAGSLILSIYTTGKCYQALEEARQQIYILAGGTVLQAESSGREDNLAVEARDHIKVFHEDFFTLDPDDRMIRATITRALYLGDASVKKEYDNLVESGYYTNIIAANISQRVVVDSIRLDLQQKPFHFRCFATETLTRATSVVTRSLITEGDLRTVSRSANNSHGFLIEQWRVNENKNLKTEKR